MDTQGSPLGALQRGHGLSSEEGELLPGFSLSFSWQRAQWGLVVTPCTSPRMVTQGLPALAPHDGQVRMMMALLSSAVILVFCVIAFFFSLELTTRLS